MACGCPVLCSNATSLPEVVGDAGLTFDPNSAEDIAAKIWHVWSNSSELKRMSVEGLERVKLFNWEAIARTTLAVYQKSLCD